MSNTSSADINKKNSNSPLTIYQKYLELIYYTNAIKSYKPNDKLKYLNELDINLNLLKIQVRLSYKYKYITMQNYTFWSSLITDICNMLGGWINSCLKR